MRTRAIPERAEPLSPAQAAEMLQLRLKKHHVAIMLLHWFNATTWLLELVTGAALIVSKHFRVAPQGYVSVIEGLFGSRAGMLRVHVGLGLVWIVVFLVYGLFGFRTYLGREVIHREMALDRDDLRWLVVRLNLILGRTREPLPPQGSYNAGQKLFGWLVYVMIPLIMLSGLVMTFHLLGTAAVGWAIVLHFAAVGAVVAGLMIHVYMGAVFPEEKSAFFSMITGTVDEVYAYHHHFKWWREMKLEEREWLDRHTGREAEAPEAAPAADPAASGDPTT